MKTISKIFGAAALLASVAMVSPAHATYTSSIGISDSGGNGSTVVPSGNLSLATTFVINGGDATIGDQAFRQIPNGNGVMYQSSKPYLAVTGTNWDFGAGQSGSFVLGTAFTLTWTANGDNFVFTASNGDFAHSSVGASSFLNIAFVGTLVSTGTDIFTQSALFSDTSTQTGVNNPISDAMTLSTPAPAPEPASIALLAAGLIGLTGFARRRRG